MVRHPQMCQPVPAAALPSTSMRLRTGCSTMAAAVIVSGCMQRISTAGFATRCASAISQHGRPPLVCAWTHSSAAWKQTEHSCKMDAVDKPAGTIVGISSMSTMHLVHERCAYESSFLVSNIRRLSIWKLSAMADAPGRCMHCLNLNFHANAEIHSVVQGS